MIQKFLNTRIEKIQPKLRKDFKRHAFAEFVELFSDEISSVARNKSFATLPDDEFIAMRQSLERLEIEGKEYGYKRLMFRANTLNSTIDDLINNNQRDQIRFHLKRALSDLVIETQRVLAQEKERALLGVATKNSNPIALVIDDENFDRQLVQRALRDTCEVVCAGNCKEALKKLHDIRPDIIILDVHMPDMSGTDLLNFIKDVPALSSIPVLMRSGDSTDGTVVNSMVGGALDYLNKDISMQQLRDRVTNALNDGVMRQTGSISAA